MSWSVCVNINYVAVLKPSLRKCESRDCKIFIFFCFCLCYVRLCFNVLIGNPRSSLNSQFSMRSNSLLLQEIAERERASCIYSNMETPSRQ